MKEKPLVTFVLLAYNQEQYIREAIEGAFSQTYESLEIILSDDCSNDRTFEIMQEMAGAYMGPYTVRVRQNKVNLGLAGHINKCIELANGEIISWAAGDDISMSSKMSTLVKPMLDDLTVVGVHSAVMAFSGDIKTAKKRSNKHKERINDLAYIIVRGAGLASQAHAFRKKVYDHFGPMKEDVTHEAKVMSFRESALGEIVYLDEPTIYYRLDSGISNYAGRNVDEVTINEPIKISRWYFTSIKQIAEDSKKIELSSDLRLLIEKKLLQRRLIYQINYNSFDLMALLQYLLIGDKKTKAVFSFLRRNAPHWFRSLYVRYFYSNSR